MQVLNAMLLACAGIKSPEAMASISALLAAGAVPDTWAPNGSSVRRGWCLLWQLPALLNWRLAFASDISLCLDIAVC